MTLTLLVFLLGCYFGGLIFWALCILLPSNRDPFSLIMFAWPIVIPFTAIVARRKGIELDIRTRRANDDDMET